MKELIEFVVKALVDDPGAIEVEEINNDKTITFKLRAAKNDIGKVIGKRGRTASAIRTIITAVSARQGKKAVVEIVE
ncbi:MAG: KH domain-containing protein [Candidatus Cloacimonetes bacterium]|nr:KH domain-containing protein [Candidatus Cloacimonadota bacterium]